jgi:hypothetical protein
MKNTKLGPAPTLRDTSFAAEIVVEGHTSLAVMPTGEWRRSLRTRLTQLEGAVVAWTGARPSDDERRRVTTQAMRFFCDVKGPAPAP